MAEVSPITHSRGRGALAGASGVATNERSSVGCTQGRSSGSGRGPMGRLPTLQVRRRRRGPSGRSVLTPIRHFGSPEPGVGAFTTMTPCSRPLMAPTGLPSLPSRSLSTPPPRGRPRRGPVPSSCSSGSCAITRKAARVCTPSPTRPTRKKPSRGWRRSATRHVSSGPPPSASRSCTGPAASSSRKPRWRSSSRRLTGRRRSRPRATASTRSRRPCRSGSKNIGKVAPGGALMRVTCDRLGASPESRPRHRPRHCQHPRVRARPGDHPQRAHGHRDEHPYPRGARARRRRVADDRPDSRLHRRGPAAAGRRDHRLRDHATAHPDVVPACGHLTPAARPRADLRAVGHHPRRAAGGARSRGGRGPRRRSSSSSPWRRRSARRCRSTSPSAT